MIAEFQGEYRFLSNFWPATIWFDDLEFPTVEHAYQAAKLLEDPGKRREISLLPNPAAAKAAGKRIKLRGDWGMVRVRFMRNFVHQKFRDPELAAKLLATGDQELVEGNRWHDTFWGRCHCWRHQGEGENMLGFILMEVRNELKHKQLTTR